MKLFESSKLWAVLLIALMALFAYQITATREREQERAAAEFKAKPVAEMVSLYAHGVAGSD